MLLTFALNLTLLFQAAMPDDGDAYILKSMLANGGIAGIMFIIWYYTFKQSKKDFTTALEQNQDQFDFALKQNQTQFESAIRLLSQQYKDSIEQSQKSIDRLFEFIRKDVEYKEILAGVLTEIKNTLVNQKDN
ncbi:MAG TPA: hypothetical protein PLT92_13650 [Ignavibacteriaceae bacterium]|nr:hypothetical protein [Ignavibacteriaceae bacterium]